MASPAVDRMDKAQRRRLMAALIASAIADGKLDAGAVDLAGLLFGDPDLWTDFSAHGAIVEGVLAASPPAVSTTENKLVGDALPRAMMLLEDDVVGILKIQDAQGRNGAGKSGDDTEYRRLRSKLRNYARYLAERSDYERLNRHLQETYSRPQMDNAAPSDLAKEFSLPLADVELCRLEVQALLAILSAPHGVDPRQFVPQTDNGTARRKLVLLDTTGRPTWGRLKAAADRRRLGKRKPANDLSASPVDQTASKAGLVGPTSFGSDPDRQALTEAAIVDARLGLQLDDEKREALPADWRTARLPIVRIILLSPYPRQRRVDTALAAFEYPALQECVGAEPSLIHILERQASGQRSRLIQQANEGPPDEKITNVPIAGRWWRAMRFYSACQGISVGDNAPDQWPEPWEYISAARADVYSEMARDGVRELLAAVHILGALHGREMNDWPHILAEISTRGEVYRELALKAGSVADWESCIKAMAFGWMDKWNSLSMGELPGFRGEEEALTPPA